MSRRLRLRKIWALRGALHPGGRGRKSRVGLHRPNHLPPNIDLQHSGPCTARWQVVNITSSRWSVPARHSKTASSSKDPTDQRVLTSKLRDTSIHRVLTIPLVMQVQLVLLVSTAHSRFAT